MSNNLVVAIADCFSKISRLLLIFLFCILFPISGQTQSFTETALTAANAAHNADLPSWQPNGETILYTRYYNSGSYQYYNHNIFSVLGNASTISETQVVNFTVSGDFPVSISWFGATPIIAEQSGWAHEYLSFIIPSTLPLTRSVNDGSSSGFSVKLKGNNNMVAGDVEWGDLVRVSRDGSTVLIRWASLKDASYNRTVKIYTGPYSSMAGQFMVNGTEPHWEDASGVVNHPSLTTTQHYMTVQEATYQFGASLTPDGSKFAITDGSNIWLLNSDGSGTPMKIAPGVQNQSGYTCYNCVWYRYPEISPDGSKLLVSKQTTNAAGNPGTAGLYMMNLDGSEENPIITGTGLLIKWPSFAPDGKRAAYVKGTQIYRVSGLNGINDCNNNNIPDACDVVTTSAPGFCVNYCTSPGICQQSSDCNSNAKPDSCETDTDSDGAIDECDTCPNDPLKQLAGSCGCGILETDDDSDGTPNCVDSCSSDPLKTTPEVCGCGIPDVDTDNDGHANCVDLCGNDPNKKAPGACGCGNPDIDIDNDTTPDCIDACPNDAGKIAIGICGCGVPDVDSDIVYQTALMPVQMIY